jgi:hypothetical protein
MLGDLMAYDMLRWNEHLNAVGAVISFERDQLIVPVGQNGIAGSKDCNTYRYRSCQRSGNYGGPSHLPYNIIDLAIAALP